MNAAKTPAEIYYQAFQNKKNRVREDVTDFLCHRHPATTSQLAYLLGHKYEIVDLVCRELLDEDQIKRGWRAGSACYFI